MADVRFFNRAWESSSFYRLVGFVAARSTPRTASGTETAVAPVSAAKFESVSGPRELATKTSVPTPWNDELVCRRSGRRL